jgi:hypothetical protein
MLNASFHIQGSGERLTGPLWFDEKDGGGFSAPGLIAPIVARS